MSIILNFKSLITLVLLICCCTGLSAQSGKVQVEARAGHNTVFGGFVAPSIEAEYSLQDYFAISGGVQYNSIGKTAIEARPSYFHDLKWGRISAEALLHYSYMSALNNHAAGAGIGLKSKWIDAKLGYYYRLYGANGYKITEPFNLYYHGTVHCLAIAQKWDLDLTITNCETFEVERHYQPSFIVQGWYYPKEFLGITLGATYKPSGIFHISTDYYQFYTKAGICYRW